MGLSMKQLDERIVRLEDREEINKTAIASLIETNSTFMQMIGAVVENEASPPQADGLSEHETDVMVAVIKALYAQRAQGAFNHANYLSEKYFPGIDLTVGDEVTLARELYSSGRTDQ